jgi:hypothetical protein
MTERMRTTISIDPDVHAIFVAMAATTGQSVSRTMGDWLADTAEGAQFVRLKMEEARRAPMAVMREMQAMSNGLQESVMVDLERLRQQSKSPPAAAGAARARPAAAGGRSAAPSSNTGRLEKNRGGKSRSKGQP